MVNAYDAITMGAYVVIGSLAGASVMTAVKSINNGSDIRLF